MEGRLGGVCNLCKKSFGINAWIYECKCGLRSCPNDTSQCPKCHNVYCNKHITVDGVCRNCWDNNIVQSINILMNVYGKRNDCCANSLVRFVINILRLMETAEIAGITTLFKTQTFKNVLTNVRGKRNNLVRFVHRF
jgi:hypothetical protein